MLRKRERERPLALVLFLREIGSPSPLADRPPHWQDIRLALSMRSEFAAALSRRYPGIVRSKHPGVRANVEVYKVRKGGPRRSGGGARSESWTPEEEGKALQTVEERRDALGSPRARAKKRFASISKLANVSSPAERDFAPWTFMRNLSYFGRHVFTYAVLSVKTVKCYSHISGEFSKTSNVARELYPSQSIFLPGVTLFAFDSRY